MSEREPYYSSRQLSHLRFAFENSFPVLSVDEILSADFSETALAIAIAHLEISKGVLLNPVSPKMLKKLDGLILTTPPPVPDFKLNTELF